MSDITKDAMIAPKKLADFLPAEYHQFVKDMKLVKEKSEPVWCSFRVSDRGTPILTIRRKPKWILRSEIETLAKEHKFDVAALYLLAKSKCPIYDTKEQGEVASEEIEEIPW